MADKRITSRTKVYLTRIGLKDWVVAVDSQKAALKAWDVHRNLFAEGAARATNDPVHVELAMKTPGQPVAVPGRVSEAALTDAAPRPPRKAKERASNVVRFPAKPHAASPARESKAPAAPDRSKVDAAEQELRAFEREAARARLEIEKRKRALETELEAFDAETERRRIRLMKRIKRERDALG